MKIFSATLLLYFFLAVEAKTITKIVNKYILPNGEFNFMIVSKCTNAVIKGKCTVNAPATTPSTNTNKSSKQPRFLKKTPEDDVVVTVVKIKDVEWRGCSLDEDVIDRDRYDISQQLVDSYSLKYTRPDRVEDVRTTHSRINIEDAFGNVLEGLVETRVYMRTEDALGVMVGDNVTDLDYSLVHDNVVTWNHVCNNTT